MKPMLSIAGKAALVTGGARGIGGAVAERLLAEGASVVVADVDPTAVDEFVATADNPLLHGLIADTSSEADVVKVVRTAVDDFGSLDLVMNNAGIAGPAELLTDISVEDFDRTVAVNQRGVFLVLRESIKQMLAQGSAGSIVNTSSAAGLRGFRMRGPYAATKHAVIGLTRVAAIEYAEQNIRVNAICPGPIMTRHLGPLAEKWGGGQEGSGFEEMTAAVPMKRIGAPSEVAALVVWLLSDEASYITGNAVPIDGGRDAK